MQNFRLKLLNQFWIQGSTDPEGDPFDLTSHGNILLEINGIDISGCQYTGSDFGINQSAVALLQTVFVDHIPQYADNRIDKPIFFHGCWIGGTCPNRVIDYQVRHELDDKIILDHFYVSGHEIDNPKRYYDVLIESDNFEYAKQILVFSEEALSFLPKNKQGDEWEVNIYDAWRTELEILIGMVKRYLIEKILSPEDQKRASRFNLSTGE